jgi:hypothetical protein
MDTINEPLMTPDGFLNPVAMSELEDAINSTPPTHERLNNDPEWTEKHWVFVKDITSYLAKWAISQSPYPYPENLDKVIKYLHACLIRQANKEEMMELSLCEINKLLYDILYEQGVEDFDNWNKSKNDTGEKIHFVSMHDGKSNPDNDFIDLDALLKNVCLSLRGDFRRNAEFDKKFEAEHGPLPQ